MSSARVRVYLAFLAVFVLGAVFGGAAIYAHTRPEYEALANDDSGDARERRRLAAFRREIGLDDAQADQVTRIVQRYRPERRHAIRSVFDQCGKPARDLKQKMEAEITALLNAEQRRRFEALQQTQRDRFPF